MCQISEVLGCCKEQDNLQMGVLCKVGRVVQKTPKEQARVPLDYGEELSNACSTQELVQFLALSAPVIVLVREERNVPPQLHSEWNKAGYEGGAGRSVSAEGTVTDVQVCHGGRGFTGIIAGAFIEKVLCGFHRT